MITMSQGTGKGNWEHSYKVPSLHMFFESGLILVKNIYIVNSETTTEIFYKNYNWLAKRRII